MRSHARPIRDRLGEFMVLDLSNFAHRIVLFGVITLLVLFVAGLFVFTPVRALSFLVGGILSLLNFKWLTDMVDVAFYADLRKRRWRIAVKFFLRYGLILLVLYGILPLSRTNVLFAFFGLFVALIAVFIECFYQLAKALRARREGDSNA